MSDQPKRPVETPQEWLRYAEADADFDAELGVMVAEGAVLNEHIVAGRYPGDLTFEEIGETQAEEALKAARHIQARVKELMRMK